MKTESRYKNKLTTESCFHLHKILDSVESGSFLGDHTDKKSFMFFRLPSDSFYHAIDSLTLIKESGWSKDANNKYTYQMVWDAKDSPNGDDLFLTIEIEKGSRFGHMRFGAW